LITNVTFVRVNSVKIQWV